MTSKTHRGSGDGLFVDTSFLSMLPRPFTNVDWGHSSVGISYAISMEMRIATAPDDLLFNIVKLFLNFQAQTIFNHV